MLIENIIVELIKQISKNDPSQVLVKLDSTINFNDDQDIE